MDEKETVGGGPKIVISAVAHKGLEVTVDGEPARLAVITEDGHVVAAGKAVARELEAVAINRYRAELKAQGRLRAYKP